MRKIRILRVITALALATLLVTANVRTIHAVPVGTVVCNGAGDPPACAACNNGCKAVCIGTTSMCEVSTDGVVCSTKGNYGDCVTGKTYGDAILDGVSYNPSFDPNFDPRAALGAWSQSAFELQLYY